MIVLFDIGSTLIEGPPVGPAKRIAEFLNLPIEIIPTLSDHLFKTAITGPDDLAKYISKEFGSDFQQAETITNELWQAQSEEAWILPGAAETLQKFKNSGIQCAYVSNIWSPFYQGFLRLFPELAQSYPSFLSFRMGTSKPDVNFYQQVLASLKATPSQTIMVGDTYKNDIAPAKMLGIRTVWILHRPQKEKADLVEVINRHSPAPDITLENIGQLSPEQINGLLAK